MFEYDVCECRGGGAWDFGGFAVDLGGRDDRWVGWTEVEGEEGRVVASESLDAEMDLQA